MANIGVKGKVTDESSQGLPNLYVAAYDEESLLGNKLLPNITTKDSPLYGLVKTASDGTFTINYGVGASTLTTKIVVRVFDSVKRLLYNSPANTNISDEFLSVQIKIPRADVDGWLVTLGTGLAVDHTSGNQVTWLIDDEETFKEIYTAIATKAKSSIHLMQLAFALPEQPKQKFDDEIPRLLMSFDPNPPEEGKKTKGGRLEQELLNASSQRNLSVCILMHNALPIYAQPVIDYFSFHSNISPGRDVDVRAFEARTEAPLHAKAAIIDGDEAFIIGSPFASDYYDSPSHLIANSRRGEVPSGFSGYRIGVPIHEVSLKILGPAVAAINEAFILHWNEPSLNSTLPKLNSSTIPAALSPDVGIQVVRTLPGEHRFSKIPHGETGILEAYQRAIRKAGEFVYLENQYFTCDEIADAIALALKDNAKLEVMLLMNHMVDIPGHNIAQRSFLRRLFSELKKDESWPKRIGLYTLWSHEKGDPSAQEEQLQLPQMMRNYVHAKVGIIDDEWATVGTANLDGVSLIQSTQNNLPISLKAILASPAFSPANYGLFGGDLDERRSSEINVIILSGIEGHAVSDDAITKWRKQLWAEHLGIGNPDGVIKPSEGWKALWDMKALEKQANLIIDPTIISQQRILPVPRDKDGMPVLPTDPDKYLKLLNIDTSKINLREKVPSFSFSKGEWEE